MKNPSLHRILKVKVYHFGIDNTLGIDYTPHKELKPNGRRRWGIFSRFMPK